jgi:hypothetical protein
LQALLVACKHVEHWLSCGAGGGRVGLVVEEQQREVSARQRPTARKATYGQKSNIKEENADDSRTSKGLSLLVASRTGQYEQ